MKTPPATAIPVPTCRGIYFLLWRGNVVYVGQSHNVPGRIQSHRKDKGKRFDKAVFIPCGATIDLDQTEREYILKYKPSQQGRYSDGTFAMPPPVMWLNGKRI